MSLDDRGTFVGFATRGPPLVILLRLTAYLSLRLCSRSVRASTLASKSAGAGLSAQQQSFPRMWDPDPWYRPSPRVVRNKKILCRFRCRRSGESGPPVPPGGGAGPMRRGEPSRSPQYWAAGRGDPQWPQSYVSRGAMSAFWVCNGELCQRGRLEGFA